MSLTEALVALESGDRAAALDELLAAWNAQRTPAIADAVDVLSVDLARALPPLDEGRTIRERHQRWLDLCHHGRAVDVPRLAATLADRNDTAPMVQERLERLEQRHPPDPRIAACLMELLCGGFRWNPKPMWTVVFRILSSLSDVRGRDRLVASLAGDRARRNDRPELTAAQVLQVPVFYRDFYARMEKLAAQLAVAPPPLDTADDARLARIVERARAFAAGPPPRIAAEPAAPAADAGARGEAELLALVWAAPGDPGPRQVYGDWCAERGLPRGEFIALQYKSSPTKRDQARARALLKANLLDWLGPLEPVVVAKSARFEGGFVAACETRFRTAKQRAELAAHPAWSTVREVVTDEPKLVQSARGLRSLRDARRKLLLRLCDGPPLAIEALRVWLDSWPTASELREALTRTRAFPLLVDFESSIEPSSGPIAPAAFAWVFACGFAPQLRRFAVTKGPAWAIGVTLAEWLPVLPRSLGEVYFNIGYFDVTLTRGERGFRVAITVRDGNLGSQYLARSLAGVDAALVEHLDVRADGELTVEQRARIERVVAPLRNGLTISGNG
jgi:uncharacterized protein (TIGR02996 family)